MRHPFVRALVLCCALLAGIALAGEQRVTLLHVNDVYQTGPVDRGQNGGLARLASLRDRVRAESPDTLLVFGGDTISPSVASSTFRGRQMIAGWNAAKLDLAVPGNHEFDYGPEVFRQRVADSNFPWLADNVLDRATGKPFGGLKRAELRRFGKLRIGFLGVLTPDTASSAKPGPGVRFEDPLMAARRAAARLRARGADIVVALTHLPMDEDFALAASGSVDLILGGHDHGVVQSLVGRTPVFKAGSDARHAVRVDLVADTDTHKLKRIDWGLLPVNAELPEDPAVARAVGAFEQQLGMLLDQPVGETAVVLDAHQLSNRSRETNLGNWIAEIYQASTGAELALLNGGSIRSNTGYGPGALSKRDILSILPFENPIVKLEISGEVLRAALEHGVSAMHLAAESGRFPQVAGMRFRYDARRPVGSRVLDIEVAGRPLDENRRYSLAVNGYLAGGGDGYAMLRGQRFLLAPENALSETDEVIGALAAASAKAPIAPKVDGRIERIDSPVAPR